MRVLDAALEAALNDNPNPYLQLQYCTDSSFTWTDAPYPLIAYKLGDLQLIVRTAGKTGFPWYAIRLKRGAIINNTANYVTSSTYYVNETSVTEKEQLEIEATILPKGTTDKYSVNGNQSYMTILDALCAHYGYTAVYEDDTAAFWDNIMYPAGRTLVLQSPHSIFTLLRQKMFIYAMDNNDEEIYFRQWLDETDIGTVSHPPLETITTFEWKKKYSLQKRLLLWRDESMVIHNYPNPITYPDLPLYNLGYIESTASTPTQYQSWHASEDKRTWHLKYQDGDIIHCSSTTYQVQVFEVYEPKEHPRLYLQFKALPKFSTTEGGPLPSTIEAAAPYTPLNVSNFNGILDANDNNIQAAMESIDDHSHDNAGTYTPASNGLTIGSGTITGKYLISGKILLCEVSFTFAADSAITGDVRMSLPVTISYGGNAQGSLTNAGVSAFEAHIDLTTTYIYIRVKKRDSADYITLSTVLSSTVPFAWGNGDVISARCWAVLP